MSKSRAARARSCPNSADEPRARRGAVVGPVGAWRRFGRTSRLVASTLVAGLVGVPVFLPGAASAAPVPLTSEQARPVGTFLNSLGVNIHMSYGKTRYADANATVAALRQLGFTHVRENFRPDNVAERQRLAVLRDAGIRFNMLIPRPDQPDGKDPARSVDMIARNFADATSSIEGPNEFNNSKMTDWPARLRESQRVLRAAVASTPATRNIPVYGPSLVGYKMPKDAPKVGDLSTSLDFGNVHSYPGGETPEQQVEQQLSTYGQYISKGKAGVATETGYHNATNNTRPSGHPSTTERTAGIYYPRLYLEYFRRGVAQTFGYELFDEGTTADQEDRFGLFRVDGSAKPAAVSLGNLTSILADDGPARSDSLPLGIADSDGDAGDVRRVLLQKSDGTFYLALWRTASIAKPGAGSASPVDKPITSSPLTVQLEKPVGSARAFRPSSGRDATDSWSATKDITTPVGPDVTLIELSPGGGPAPTDPAPDNPGEDPSGNAPDPAPGNDPSQPDDDSGNGGGDSPSQPPSRRPDLGDVLKPLNLPQLWTTDWSPERVDGKYRLLPPAAATQQVRFPRYDVDGTPLRGNVLDTTKLSPGRHIVRLWGRPNPEGKPLAGQSTWSEQVLSAQVVDVERDKPDAKIALTLLGAGLIAAQVGGIVSFRRRRRLS